MTCADKITPSLALVQNCTIPVNLEAIQNTMITSKLFRLLYLGYNQVHYIVYGLRHILSILGLIRYLQIYPQEVKLPAIAAI